MSVLTESSSIRNRATILIAGLQIAKKLGKGPQFLIWALTRMTGDKQKSKVFKGYLPGEHDVFVATFPKSGTNWAMHMVTQIAWKGAAEFEHIHDVVPWPDFPLRGLASLYDNSLWQNAPGKRRAIKTAAPARHVPLTDKATYISVFRDPKEVLVSGYYFLPGAFQLLDEVSFDYWREKVFIQGPLAHAWADHIASWWAERHRTNLLIVNFKEAKKDLNSHIERIAKLMKVELTLDEKEEVVKRCGFAWMKAHGSRFDPPPFPLLDPNKRPKMMRSGKSGNAGELLSASQKAELDEVCRNKLQEIGSDFPYDKWFE